MQGEIMVNRRMSSNMPVILTKRSIRHANKCLGCEGDLGTDKAFSSPAWLAISLSSRAGRELVRLVVDLMFPGQTPSLSRFSTRRHIPRVATYSAA